MKGFTLHVKESDPLPYCSLAANLTKAGLSEILMVSVLLLKHPVPLDSKCLTKYVPLP